jgi:hypothetical protein
MQHPSHLALSLRERGNKCKSLFRSRWLSTVALLCAASLSPSPVSADFKIGDMRTHLTASALVLSGNLDLGLSPKVEEALSKGIELPVIIEVRLYRKRMLLWDQRLAMWSFRRRLQYHALSGQYLVNNGVMQESFLALGEALKQLGTVTELRLPLPETPLGTHDEYSVKLRAHLDIEALPAPLRPVAYTTPSWHLNSGWTAWNVSLSAD